MFYLYLYFYLYVMNLFNKNVYDMKLINYLNK